MLNVTSITDTLLKSIFKFLLNYSSILETENYRLDCGLKVISTDHLQGNYSFFAYSDIDGWGTCK